MDWRRRGWRWGMAWSVTALVWSATLVVTAALLFMAGVDSATRWAGVLGVLTTVAGVTVPLVDRAAGASRRRAAGHAGQPADLLRVADQLADAVRAEWRREARLRRLQDPWPLPLRWKAADPELADYPDAVLMPAAAGAEALGPEALSGQLTEAVEVFERLRHRRLVVIGPPGSGKSVFAMTLTLAVLDRRRPGTLVPVVFPVAGWNPNTATLDEWLVDHLVRDYQLGGDANQDSRQVAMNLLAGNLILPILDGFDEIPVALRSIAVTRVNRDLDADQPFVLTCRTDEYRQALELGDALTLAAVVELQPLDLSTVITYLSGTTPAGRRARYWDPVFDRLRDEPDAPLAIVLRTPLMVFLVRTVYGDNPRNPEELLDCRLREPTQIEDRLLGELIPAVYDDRRHRHRLPWQTEEVRSWLAYLASRLGGRGGADLAWWQLERAVPRVVIHGVAALLGAGLVWFVFGPLWAAAFTLAVVLAGTAAGKRPWTVEGALADRLDSWLRRLAARSRGARIAAGVVGLADTASIERRFGLTLGRLAAIVAGGIEGLRVYRGGGGLFPALADGLGVALVVGLAAGYFTLSLRTTPSEVQFAGGRGAAVFFRHLTIGILTGVGGGVTAGALVNSRFGLLMGVLVGLALGLVDGLNVWLDVSTDVTRALSPRSTRRAERIAAFARSITVGVTIAAATVLAYGLAYGTRSAIVHGLAFGIGFALADRYLGLAATVWGRYVVAKAWLALTGRLPWRLMAFLDDAHRHGLLRRAGASYQFRHARLQEHLAGVNV